ncbi:hypothetical protein CDD81_2613 [Ophiocordyceps australis]|uniref:Centrosomin N-terminal motif 1 domain-containing protein n=1 Tax=Ophiocordyceps australis TaxID=1399860 RepID=A0A2C5XR41_9HYPO|nr:hypothetical protein CDD81_2613 [Ophiocordyceps australis]
MVQRGWGGALDTPRTNLGDATYLSRAPDIGDISQEASFHSPAKNSNLARPLVNRNGSNGHGHRGPLVDRPNLPASIGGAEFTPLLKSATRNGRLGRGKENAMAPSTTPRHDDDLTPLPRADTSIFNASRNHSQLDNTLPQVDTSSVASTPLARRQAGDGGPLQDGNQLSLREQETVIDRIEKENFGLKLKIHFLEETLHRTRPGFNEAAVKENTELKVDKVTLQRELHRFKKHLTSAEHDLESYRQQMMELQEKARRKQPDGNSRVELERLRQILDERQAQIHHLERQLGQGQDSNDEVDKLRDTIQDLEADLRHHERLLTEQQDELEHVKDEQKAQQSQDSAKQDQLDEAHETISKLQEQIDRLEVGAHDLRQQLTKALAQKDEADSHVRQLGQEMADKCKMSNSQRQDRNDEVARLQNELQHSGKEYATLEKQLARANQDNKQLQDALDEVELDRMQLHDSRREDKARVEQVERELLALGDDRDALQSRLEALTQQYASQQKHMMGVEEQVEQLDKQLFQERANALEAQRELVKQYQGEIEGLNKDVTKLQAEVREKDKLYDNDEGSQSTRQGKLQAALDSESERHKRDEAILAGQIDDLQQTVAARQALLTEQAERMAALKDEAEGEHVCDLQSQLATLKTELESTRAERDELQDGMRGMRLRDEASEERLEVAEGEVERLQHDCKALQAKLRDASDQKLVLQEMLDDMAEQLATAQQEADEGAARLHGQLQRRQAQVDKLAHQLDGLQEREASLRVKLERARGQRALLRTAVDKLERFDAPPPPPPQAPASVDLVVRALVMQMEWMQARWEREAAKRCDVACAKAFVQLQLDVAHACNKAQLRELNDIRSHLLPSRKPVLALAGSPSRPTSARSIRPLLIALRFIARSRIAARTWACHEAVRRRLAAAAKDRRSAQRSHTLLHANPAY